MSVAAHLGIATEDYDRQILTFIPHYDEILAHAAGALDALARQPRVVVDLGIGSGALAARCLADRPRTRVIGIDGDAAMLAMAQRRLGRRLTPVVANFEQAAFPPCDAVTASFSLHHIASPRVKGRVFARAFAALRPGGVLIDADSLLPTDPRRSELAMTSWRRHLAVAHGTAGATRLLRTWAGEDTYFSLDVEMALLRKAGFVVDVVWRRGAFAVLAAVRPLR